MKFRGFLYGLGMRKCGKNLQITHDAILKCLQNISFGSNCFVGNSSIIMGRGEIIIEDEVLIGPHVVIVSSNHVLLNGSFRYGVGDLGCIKIRKGSWIAANSTLQRNSELPSSSVLSANSFLNKKFFQSNSIYGGVPAIFIRSIK